MEEGKQIVDALCTAYRDHPPEKVLDLQVRAGGSLAEAVKDYVAGMTDRFAAEKASELGIVRSFLYARNGA